MRKLFPGVIVAFLLAGAAFLFLAKQKGSGRLNVLVITIDTLRSDHCSSYGYPLKTTPRIDQIAAQGVKFLLAYAPTASTFPSHSALFTSLYPISHGILKNGWVLSLEAKTLAETFLAQGYRTGAIVSSFVLDNRFGLSQGFLTYAADFNATDSSIKWRRWRGNKVAGGFDRGADKTTSKGIDWLTRYGNGKEPFLLWIHYFDPHGPYDPPEPYKTLFKTQEPGLDNREQAIRSYDGEINFTDHELGRLIDYLDSHELKENTLLIITGDHGEGLMQHGRMGHGRQIYEEEVRVPLILRLPGRVRAGLTLQGPVELVDVMPTVLEMAGIPTTGLHCQGTSLASFLTGKSIPDPNRKVYLQRRRYDDLKGDKFGLRSQNYKYIEALEEGTQELYDLNIDPRETVNLAPSLFQKTQEFSSVLKAFQQIHPLQLKDIQDVSEEDAERLRALGYVQ